MDQFHGNAAISAVADDAFLVEEDEYYDDFYNDVNVGEGVLQSIRKNDEAAGLRKREQEKISFERSKESVSTPERQVLIPGVVGETSTSGTDACNGYGAQGLTGGSGVSQQVPVAGLRVELGQATNLEDDVETPRVSQGLLPPAQIVGNNEPLVKPGMSNVNGVTIPVRSTIGNGGGGTILYLGDLHWWTTDAEIEAELCKYGTVKEVKFFDEKATGKSRGYCQVEFCESMAATACKEGLDGHLFDGRPCVVAFASPYNVKKMGEAQANRSQQAQSILAQANEVDPPSKPPSTNSITTSGNHQGGDGRGFGRGNWGRGYGQGMGGRGQVGQLRNRPVGMGGRGLMGNGGGGFGQGIGSGLPMMHPQAMMGSFAGRMGSYGGFPPPFPGPLSSFPRVGGAGLPGVAPHVNPAFFGRGMPMSGMGMMPNMGLCDPNAGGWGGEDLCGVRAAESSYGEEAASDHQYGEVNHDRGARSNPVKEKDRAAEREWSASSDRRNRDEKDGGRERGTTRERGVRQTHDSPEKRHRDDRDAGREREREHHKDGERSRDWNREREKERGRHREERERYGDHHRHKDEPEHDNEWNRSRSSRATSKSRLSREDIHRSRSKEANHGKRRRLTSE